MIKGSNIHYLYLQPVNSWERPWWTDKTSLVHRTVRKHSMNPSWNEIFNNFTSLRQRGNKLLDSTNEARKAGPFPSWRIPWYEPGPGQGFFLLRESLLLPLLLVWGPVPPCLQVVLNVTEAAQRNRIDAESNNLKSWWLSHSSPPLCSCKFWVVPDMSLWLYSHLFLFFFVVSLFWFGFFVLFVFWENRQRQWVLFWKLLSFG